MSDNAIFLRATNDNYHALKFDSFLGGVGLWGANGGYLGSTADGKTIKKAVEWYWDNKVSINGNLTVVDSIKIGRWTLYDRGDGFGFIGPNGLSYFMWDGKTGLWCEAGNHVIAPHATGVITCKGINVTG